MKTPDSLFGDLEVFEFRNADSIAKVSRFGAQLLSWRCGELELLYQNPKLISDKSKPLRAGAPVCFPWFNKGLRWKLGKEIAPSHGPSRSADWNLIHQKQDSLTFSYKANSPRDLPLQIIASYCVERQSLVAKFKVQNLSDKENAFELALHTYFSCAAPQAISIEGLKDFPHGLKPEIPIDQVFVNRDTKVQIQMPERTLKIENTSFNNSVVWHPGQDHSIADLPKPSDLVPFICVESLTDVTVVKPLAGWNGIVRYSLG